MVDLMEPTGFQITPAEAHRALGVKESEQPQSHIFNIGGQRTEVMVPARNDRAWRKFGSVPLHYNSANPPASKEEAEFSDVNANLNVRSLSTGSRSLGIAPSAELVEKGGSIEILVPQRDEKGAILRGEDNEPLYMWQKAAGTPDTVTPMSWYNNPLLLAKTNVGVPSVSLEGMYRVNYPGRPVSMRRVEANFGSSLPDFYSNTVVDVSTVPVFVTSVSA